MVTRKVGRKSKPSKRTTRRLTRATMSVNRALPTMTLKKAVRAIVRKDSETKYVAEQTLDAWSAPTIPAVYVNFNSAVATNADWYRCLPQVTQGDDAHQRNGNEIQPTAVKVHLNFKFDQTTLDANSRDIFCVLYCGRPREVTAYNAATANSVWPSGFNKYLDNGDGTETNFSGEWTDAIKKIANHNFVLKAKRIIHLFKPQGLQNNNSGITAVTSAPQVYNKSTTITFKNLPKLKYVNSAATLPSNFAHCFAVGYYYADGSSPDLGGGLLKVSSRLEMFYKDS